MTDVDEPARPALIGIPARYPDLPDSLRTSRTVLVEYVVDTTGKVDLATVRGRAPERDAPFLEELRRVMPEWEFYPAVKGGAKVRQVIRQAFVFEPPAR